MFNDSGLLVGNISTNDGASFATDGNVYLKSNGYSDWLTNILNSKISTNASCNKNWYYQGLEGQPAWYWGTGGDGVNMYLYSPANLTVSRCTDGIISPPVGIVVDLSADGGEFRSYNSSYAVLDNTVRLGSGNARWKQLYAATTTISTSDRNLKKNIKPLSNKYIELFKLLQPVSFAFKDGDSGRTHIGFISQDVEDALDKVGLTALDFSGFCKDIKTTCQRDENKNEEEIPVLDEDGNPQYIYSLRYEEFIALNTCMIQELEKRVSKLEGIITDN